MKTNSKTISLAISLLITIFLMTTTRFTIGLSGTKWWYLGGISLLFGFLISLGIIELLLFKDIRKLLGILSQLGSDENAQQPVSTRKQTFQNLEQAVISYAEIKQLEIDELKNTAAYRREFLADISHELKTPIFAAQGYLHTLLDGAIEDSNVRLRFLKRAAKSLDGLDVLVQDLLTLSRLETGEVIMDLQSFNMYDLTVEVFEQLEEKADKKNIKLGLGSGVYKSIHVKADYHRILQVMRNLILNGINYTEDRGRVVVDFEKKMDRVVIHVKDTGKGIPPEHLDHIFERFYRVEKSRAKSKDRGGTGLGLAIVKHILELHKTQVKVKSVLDKGSDFYFELPEGEGIK